MEESSVQDKITDLEAKLANMPSDLSEGETHQQYKNWYRDLGEAYAEAKQAEKATQLFEQLLNEGPQSYQALAAYELGKLALDESNYQMASERFNQAIASGKERNDEETLAKAQHAYAYLILQFGQNTPVQQAAFKQNIEEAIQLFRKQKKYENLGKAFMMLAGYAQAHLTMSEAIAHLQEMLAQAQNDQAPDLEGFIHYQLGMHYEADENSKDAFKHFEQALHLKNEHKITVDLGETYYHLGALHDDQGETEKAFEYNVTALRHMLEMTEMSTHIGMAVIFLQAGMESITNEDLKSEAATLLEQAKEKGLMPEEETGEQLVYNEPKIGEVLEQTREQMEQAEGLALEELKENYETQKAALPKEAETFAETAYDLLVRLEEGIDRSVFSFLARKKNKARRAELENTLKDAQNTLNGVLENITDDEQKENVEAWLKKVADDFVE
ncbi:MAG TPA: hypothetical protein DCS93_30950 [Microscillaceae bacterium]|nr:hypothetical protein [Microscillaceae bacterium]